MNNNELTFISYDDFAKKFTTLRKSTYNSLLERKTINNKPIKSSRSKFTKQIKTYLYDSAEAESVRRITTETIATILKDVDNSHRIKMQALIEPDVYKEIMEHLNTLENDSHISLVSAKESLINKYMTSSVLSTLISRNFQNDFTQKCAKLGTDVYKRCTTSYRSGALIDGIGVALTSNSANELRSENGGYFYIQDAIAYTNLLQKKQEKFLRKIVGNIKLPALINMAKNRQTQKTHHAIKDIRPYLAMGESSGMCKFSSFQEFFSVVCASPATVSILTAMQNESESQR